MHARRYMQQKSSDHLDFPYFFPVINRRKSVLKYLRIYILLHTYLFQIDVLADS